MALPLFPCRKSPKGDIRCTLDGRVTMVATNVKGSGVNYIKKQKKSPQRNTRHSTRTPRGTNGLPVDIAYQHYSPHLSIFGVATYRRQTATEPASALCRSQS